MWPRGRMKFVPYKQVSYTVKTNVHAVNTHNKGMRDGNNCTRRLIYDNGYYTSRNNIFPVEGHNAIVKVERGVKSNDTPNSML